MGMNLSPDATTSAKVWYRNLTELGVEIEFLTPKARFHLGDHVVNFPPDSSTILKLARRLPRLISAIRHARRSPQQTIGQLIDKHLHDRLLADLACLPVYGMMRSPDDVTISDIQRDFLQRARLWLRKELHARRWSAHHDRRDGPPLRATRRKLRLGCVSACGTRGRGEASSYVRVGTLRARTVLSSQGRSQHFPSGTKPGIEIAFLMLAVGKHLPYPRGYHTIAWFQAGIAAELRRLDAGLPISRAASTSSALTCRRNRTITR